MTNIVRINNFFIIFNLLLTGCKITQKIHNYFDNNYGFSFTFYRKSQFIP